jgi:hypothetical protein
VNDTLPRRRSPAGNKRVRQYPHDQLRIVSLEVESAVTTGDPWTLGVGPIPVERPRSGR